MMGYGYGGQYSCQSCEPLSCGVICYEKYFLVETTQDDIFVVTDVSYECRKCVEASNEPSRELSPVPSSAPSGEASAVPTPSPSHDTCVMAVNIVAKVVNLYPVVSFAPKITAS